MQVKLNSMLNINKKLN